MMVRVIKRFKNDDGELLPGQEVDASMWRNLRGLISSRFVMPLEAQASIPEPVHAPLPMTVTAPISDPPKARRPRVVRAHA